MPVFIRHCPAGTLEQIVIARSGQSSVHNELILTSIILAKAEILDFCDSGCEPTFSLFVASH